MPDSTIKAEFKIQEGDTVSVRVIPRASAARVEIETENDMLPQFKAFVNVPPEKGKANRLMLKLLAKKLGVPQSSLTIIRGKTSRQKVVRLESY